MSQSEKSELYQELKSAGVKFEKQYRQYTTDELAAGVDRLRAHTGQPPRVVAPVGPDVFGNDPLPPRPQQVLPEEAAPTYQFTPQHAQPVQDTEAGLRQNTADEGPRRIDENGLAWYQDEVRKSAIPKPRGRRVLRYIETGTETRTVVNDQFHETFEVAGKGTQQGEVKITLPSYQVGIYQDPRFPFKIHIYNEIRGFDFFEVNEFYRGADLVPDECKRMYVENVLCYDIRTVVRAIETEARQLELSNQRGM